MHHFWTNSISLAIKDLVNLFKFQYLPWIKFWLATNGSAMFSLGNSMRKIWARRTFIPSGMFVSRTIQKDNQFGPWRNSLVRAFTLWEEASQLLIFSEHIATHGRGKAAADVNIHFLVGEHGDGMPFDGPGIVQNSCYHFHLSLEGMIAHAFFPPVGELHLDAEEHWTLETGATGTNLYQARE